VRWECWASLAASPRAPTMQEQPSTHCTKRANAPSSPLLFPPSTTTTRFSRAASTDCPQPAAEPYHGLVCLRSVALRASAQAIDDSQSERHAASCGFHEHYAPIPRVGPGGTRRLRGRVTLRLGRAGGRWLSLHAHLSGRRRQRPL
jgi:hypothetical protein